MSRDERAQVEAEIERLIGLLDALDGDADFEESAEDEREEDAGAEDFGFDQEEPSFLCPNGSHVWGGGSGY